MLCILNDLSQVDGEIVIINQLRAILPAGDTESVNNPEEKAKQKPLTFCFVRKRYVFNLADICRCQL